MNKIGNSNLSLSIVPSWEAPSVYRTAPPAVSIYSTQYVTEIHICQHTPLILWFIVYYSVYKTLSLDKFHHNRVVILK